MENALVNPVSDTLTEASPDVEGGLTGLAGIKDDAGLIGFKAFEEDRVAVCVLAGGMGSRLGTAKWMSRIPVMGIQASALRIAMSSVSGIGKTFYPGVWSLVPRKFEGGARSAAEEVKGKHIIVQDEWFTVNPMFDLIKDDAGPVMYPTGTGDALHKMFKDKTFREWCDQGGQRYIYTVAVDNVYAGPDVAMLGDHIQNGASASWETVERNKTDSDEPGVIWTGGRLQAIRPHRLPHGVESSELTHTVTHTGIINADVAWRWCNETRPRYERRQAIINGAVTLHLERDLHQITETVRSRFVQVPRSKRYLPMRTREDIELLKALLMGHQIIPSGMGMDS
jgi:hypothetical protein